MTEQQKQEAIQFIEGQLRNGYVDLSSTYDGNELKIIEAAVELYKKRQNNYAHWKWERDHWSCSRCGGNRFHNLLLGCDAAYCGHCGAEMIKEEDI